jgi:hypothetical protein
VGSRAGVGGRIRPRNSPMSALLCGPVALRVCGVAGVLPPTGPGAGPGGGAGVTGAGPGPRGGGE